MKTEEITQYLTELNDELHAIDIKDLFAMKALAGRADTSDRKDIEFSIPELKLTDVNAAVAIVEKYYPQQRIKPATQYMLEEIFQQAE